MGIGNFRKSSDDDQTPALSERGSMLDPRSIPKDQHEDEEDVKVKPKAQTPTTMLVDALERGFKKDVNELEEVVAPIKPYKERLADAGISLEYARNVLSHLIDSGGQYAEDVRLSPRTTVRFRTRQFADTMRTYAAIERETPRYADTTDSIQLRYMLAASLEAYGEKTFRFPRTTDTSELDDAFGERLAFVQGLSDFAVRVLAREFSKFDQKIALILSDGAVEAF